MDQIEFLDFIIEKTRSRDLLWHPYGELLKAEKEGAKFELCIYTETVLFSGVITTKNHYLSVEYEGKTNYIDSYQTLVQKKLIELQGVAKDQAAKLLASQNETS